MNTSSNQNSGGLHAEPAPGLHKYAVFTAICTFLLLVAGALVTSNDAGLSVPTWPLAWGSVAPPMVGGIVYEWSHRVIAASVGFLTIILALWLWIAEKRPWMRWLGYGGFGTPDLQIVDDLFHASHGGGL